MKIMAALPGGGQVSGQEVQCLTKTPLKSALFLWSAIEFFKQMKPSPCSFLSHKIYILFSKTPPVCLGIKSISASQLKNRADGALAEFKQDISMLSPVNAVVRAILQCSHWDVKNREKRNFTSANAAQNSFANCLTLFFGLLQCTWQKLLERDTYTRIKKKKLISTCSRLKELEGI